MQLFDLTHPEGPTTFLKIKSQIWGIFYSRYPPQNQILRTFCFIQPFDKTQPRGPIWEFGGSSEWNSFPIYFELATNDIRHRWIAGCGLPGWVPIYLQSFSQTARSCLQKLPLHGPTQALFGLYSPGGGWLRAQTYELTFPGWMWSSMPNFNPWGQMVWLPIPDKYTRMHSHRQLPFLYR